MQIKKPSNRSTQCFSFRPRRSWAGVFCLAGLFVAVSVFSFAGSALASGSTGSIPANSTITIINSTSTLRYASFNYLPGINYIQIGCGGTFTNQTAYESSYEILCSNIQLKNTNLTSVYSYSVIYGTTSEMSLLESILNKPNATSSVSIPDPIRTIPFGSAYATNSSGTISVLIDQSWTYGELFLAFCWLLSLTMVIFYFIFSTLK